MAATQYLQEWEPTLFRVVLENGDFAAMRDVDRAYERREITARQAAERYVDLARDAFWKIEVQVPTPVEDLSPLSETAA